MPGQYGDELIYTVTHLTDLPQADVALRTIRKMASLVKPIIRAHGWKVGLLGEFYPEESGLLGLNCNHGQTIHVRLRHGSNPAAFFPFEMSMDTLLHELCHNTFGPHDQKFHMMWDQLRDEYWALKQKGFTGESFLGRGYMLGGKVSRQEARRIARVEASKREVETQKKGISKRLGGRPPPFGGNNPRQAARDTFARAAEERMTMCGVGRRGSEQDRLVSDSKAHSATTRLEKDTENEIAIQQAFIDLVQEERVDLARQKYGDSGATFNQPMLISDDNDAAGPSNSGKYSETLIEDDERWECAACTLLNQPEDDACAVCGMVKAGKEEKGRGQGMRRPVSKEEVVLVDDEADGWWRCGNCTLVNKAADRYCDACECDRDGRPKGKGAAAANPKSAASGSRTQSVASGSGSKPKPQRVLGVQMPVTVKEASPFWKCSGCGLTNESTWWTCTGCKAVKKSSD